LAGNCASVNRCASLISALVTRRASSGRCTFNQATNCSTALAVPAAVPLPKIRIRLAVFSASAIGPKNRWGFGSP
jgi:hypothetical protein